MTINITVREHARLTTELVELPTLDRVQLTKSAFNWLCNATIGPDSQRSLVQLVAASTVKVDNFVGVIETPCGTRIEILPKIAEEVDHAGDSRRVLRKMISAALDLPVRAVTETALQLFDAPISEWIFWRYLEALDVLVKRGIRFDYLRVEAQERYMRGQLDLVRQLRAAPGRSHMFEIRHDVFSPDRAENRLLRSALEYVCRNTRRPENWRLAQELRILLSDIPCSGNVRQDFLKWSDDRLNAHYKYVRPWCELILRREMPFSVSGEWRGISMLFPMEKLFEKYVAATLRPRLLRGAQLIEQARSAWMCSHQSSNIFNLKPDMLVTRESETWILDAKWKRIDGSDRRSNYSIDQADIYQMFAYGHKYMGGVGQMYLVYPSHGLFKKPIARFVFSETLSLSAIPFGLDDAVLVLPQSGASFLREEAQGAYPPF